jgi:adenylate cyclase
MGQVAKLEHRLAAIMATDVVGYSQTMQSDEAGTLAGLGAIREATENQIKQHRGRIANTAGDSVLAEFASAVEAVSCAMVLQEVLTQHGKGGGLQVRIGIHAGDVIDRNGDLHGTAVNIAARLEGVAPPGGIIVSSSVREDVSGKLSASFIDLGSKSLKNIAGSIRVFSVSPQIGGSVAAIREADRRLKLTREASTSIAVLPFANLSNDAEQEFLADGLTEDLITELSRLKNFLVIARNTVFTYKDKSLDVGQIGRELGVRYVLEGSVRRLGPRVRITAQLIRTDTASHLWAEKFDRDFADLFDVQDEVVRAVVASTHTRLIINEGEIAEQTVGADLDYWELVKRGMAASYRFTPEGLKEAVRIGNQLVEGFQHLARGHQILADALYKQMIMGFRPATKELKDKIVWEAREAARLGPGDEFCLLVHGKVLTLALGQAEEGIALFRQILSINPNFCIAYGLLGNAYSLIGQPDEAIRHIEIAIRLDPRDPGLYFRYSSLAEAHFLRQDHQQTLHWTRQSTALKPDYWWPYAIAAATYVELGDAQGGQRSFQSLLRAMPGASLSGIKELNFYPEFLWARLSRGLLAAGLPK